MKFTKQNHCDIEILWNLQLSNNFIESKFSGTDKINLSN